MGFYGNIGTMNSIWYKSPAKNWNEALPVGNGRLGAMVYGNPGHEIIQLNEESIWSGVYRNRNNGSCRKSLSKIRELISQGHIQEAQELAFETMTGTPSQQTVYQTAGELHIDYYTAESVGLEGPLPDRRDAFGTVSAYKRELDLETAIVTTTFSTESTVPSTAIFSRNSRGSTITYTREVFASAPADVLVIRVTASTPKSVFFRAYLDRGNFAGRSYALREDTIALQDRHGIPFCAMVTAVPSGGTVETKGNMLVVEGADEVTLYVDIQTAYRIRGYERKGGNILRTQRGLVTWCADEVLRKLCFASSGVYENLRTAHIEDYEQLYRRVSLSLCPESTGAESSVPTDILLSMHPESPALAQLYWNYSRYLLISCSRSPGTLPANLQGIWNRDMDPPWGSKYTININTEMNYWPASICGLEECELPLFALLKKAARNGKRTAREMYGCYGYVAHHNLDIWGDTAPQDMWIPGTYWVLGAAWLATHVREHYEYTLDKKFLRRNYKLLKGACDFFADFLVPSADGKHLVVSPSVSPENSYRLPSGEKGSLCAGCDMDNRILEHLFAATLQSARDLEKNETDPDIQKFQEILSKIEGPVITKDGTIREWPVECEEVEPGHRHMSHLYGLFPGHTISVSRTPELAKAAAATIEKRLENGGGHTGWSQAWIMNFRASLHQGKEAYESLVSLFKNSTLPNLFDNHPPFQIDGNFGALAAITRMIAQSEMIEDCVYVDILPALPEKWRSGSLHGVCLKGNLRMDLAWENGGLKSACLYALPGTNFTDSVVVRYRGREYAAPLTDGKLDVLNILPATI